MISKGNHVKFARFVLLAVSEEAKTWLQFFVQCITKQLLDSVSVISRIIKVSVRVISLSLRLRLLTLTSTLIILDITKTSCNNCLLLAQICCSDFNNTSMVSPKMCINVKNSWNGQERHQCSLTYGERGNYNFSNDCHLLFTFPRRDLTHFVISKLPRVKKVA